MTDALAEQVMHEVSTLLAAKDYDAAADRVVQLVVEHTSVDAARKGVERVLQIVTRQATALGMDSTTILSAVSTALVPQGEAN